MRSGPVGRPALDTARTGDMKGREMTQRPEDPIEIVSRDASMVNRLVLRYVGPVVHLAPLLRTMATTHGPAVRLVTVAAERAR